MTVTASIDEINFTTKSTVKFTGISRELAKDEEHLLTADFNNECDWWSLWVDIPECSTEDPWVGIYFKPSDVLTRQLGEKYSIKVTFTLQSLLGKVAEQRSFVYNWPPEKPELAHGYDEYANWDVFWNKMKLRVRRTDFRLWWRPHPCRKPLGPSYLTLIFSKICQISSMVLMS